MSRTEYEMSEADLAGILAACKPTPVMMVGSYMTSLPQENANNAWARLGTKMGFDGATVRPKQGGGQRFFTAIPTDKECYDCGTTHNIRCISDGWGPFKPEYSCEECFHSTDEGPCWDETGPLIQAETAEA